MIKEATFSRVEDFFDFLSPWGDSPGLEGYIFRGQSQESYKLVPTALREGCIEDFRRGRFSRSDPKEYNLHHIQIIEEYQILRDFYRLADQRGLEVPLSERVRSNLATEIDLMGILSQEREELWIPPDLQETAALAQHYGLPTRLLDWTYDLYVAMYFAFRGAIGKTGNIVVWALNKERLSFLKRASARVNVEFITPHYSGNPHLNAQKGLFTLWPVTALPLRLVAQDVTSENPQLVDRTPLDELVLNQMEGTFEKVLIEEMFRKFVLPCSEAVKGCSILDKLGYDSARIFPGYGGVAAQLKDRAKYY
ncbi:TPA: FRG domain-containing protein [Pseudomonas putida]|nr:FRG domain-containing protein [Pseudomonas putida]